MRQDRLQSGGVGDNDAGGGITPRRRWVMVSLAVLVLVLVGTAVGVDRANHRGDELSSGPFHVVGRVAA